MRGKQTSIKALTMDVVSSLLQCITLIASARQLVCCATLRWALLSIDNIIPNCWIFLFNNSALGFKFLTINKIGISYVFLEYLFLVFKNVSVCAIHDYLLNLNENMLCEVLHNFVWKNPAYYKKYAYKYKI